MVVNVKYLLILSLTLPSIGLGLDQRDADTIPHVRPNARESFIEYIYSDPHRAYAIAPGGVWAWVAGQADEQVARTQALQQCQQHSLQACVLYAINDTRVFDAERWPTLWRPYTNRQQADTVPIGIERGKQFPNLVFKNDEGHSMHLSQLEGEVRIVHFWGSWCPPCLREMPHLLEIHQSLKETIGEHVAMILLQVREPFSTSLAWMQRHRFDQLPLYDSMVEGGDTLRTQNGQSIPDRQLAKTFPTTYILDRHGIVLFSQYGPIHNWHEYLPFLVDVVQQTHRPPTPTQQKLPTLDQTP